MPTSKDEKYISQLLESWEQTFNKGLLTFWVLASLRASPKSLEEITDFIRTNSDDMVSFDDQSIYRALRKYYETELVDYELRDSERGPQRKYYQLTAIGEELLLRFFNRNIRIYQSNIFAYLKK